MALTPSSDLTAAAWIIATDEPWHRLVLFGPAGFEDYARVRFIPDPVDEGQRENDVELDPHTPSESTQLRAVVDVLRHYTSTPDDCYFCVWDGWGWTPEPAPDVSPSVFDGPKVVVPNRAYYLLRGSTSDLHDWGSVEMQGRRRDTPDPDPAFVWPADHAWCLANDVDPHWAGVGAVRDAIDQLLADPRLDVVRADPGEAQPHYS